MKKWGRRIAIGLASLIGLIILLVVGANIASASRQRTIYQVPPSGIRAVTDPASIERGRHLVEAVGKCGECHGADLGGRAMLESPVMGTLHASNLTSGRGGLDSAFADEDWVRAIRHGVRRDGRSLIFMPAEGFQRFSDADLASIIAYMRTVPPVDRETPEPRIGPLARVLHLAVGLPLLPAELVNHTARPAVPARAVSVEYGEYLAVTGGCTGCHGPQLAGSGAGGPNITSGRLGAWTEADFMRALREGKRPDGTTISEAMPWKAAGKMTDDEIRAVWMYVRSLPPVAP